jgi:CPA1 family monovalent cation:H+ antiporter
MRGVVSLAAALAIPVTLDDGSAFPYRNLILFITFVVILLTLLLQGLTLPIIIKKTRLFDLANDDAEETTRHQLKHGLRDHTYQFLKTKYDGDLHDHAGLQKMLHHWEEKIKAADDRWMDEQTKLIFFEMLQQQREFLVILNKRPDTDEETIRQQLYLIDLEEERLKMQF